MAFQNRIKLGLLFLVLISCGSANALDKGQFTLDVNIGSKHSKDTYGSGTAYNEDNFGLGATYAYSDWLDIKGGFFDNSYDKTSYYAGAFVHKDFKAGDFVVSPGAALLMTTGYDDTPENAPTIAPVPVLGVALGFDRLRANIGYSPFGDVSVWMLQAQWVLSD